MKKIAIFTSGEGECAMRLVSLFNEGNRIRVDLVVSDQGAGRIVQQMMDREVNAMYLPRDVWQEHPENVITLLKDSDIELIALDGFAGVLPEDVAREFAGRVITLTSPDEAPREVVSALSHLDEKSEEAKADAEEEMAAKVCGEGAECVPGGSTPPEIPKSVDEEWAETLKLKYDPEQVRPTPPPIPDESARQQPKNTAEKSPSTGGRPYFQMQQPMGQSVMPAQQEPMPSTNLVWSILCTVFCCFIPGIVAIIFSSQVSSKYYVGDIEGAKRASRNAEIWIIVSFVLGVISATLYLPIMLVCG